MASVAEDTTRRKSKSNEVRISFAEWLFRMNEARLPPQARELAIYAVVFKVSSNDELAQIAGMDTQIKGRPIADKTYNKWKRQVLEEGFVILKATTIGRTTSIEVWPALPGKTGDASPVTFTDMIARDARRFYGRTDESKSYGKDVEVTDEISVSSVTVTDEQDSSVEVTGVSCAPPPAQMESPSGINKSLEINNNQQRLEQEAARNCGRYDADFPNLNGTAFDLVGFIVKHTQTSESEARHMLKTNLGAFGSDAMLTAYSATLAEMAVRIIGQPYKYLIKTAQNLKSGGRSQKQPDDDKKAALKAQREKIRAEFGWTGGANG